MVPSRTQSVADYPTHNFVVADCLITPKLDRIMRAGKTIHIEPKAMQVLVCLASRGREVVSKQELLDEVWAGTFVSDHVLSHVIWQLRKALGSADLIETIPRRGYRLTVEAVLESQPPENPLIGGTGPRNGARRWLLASVGAMALLAVAGALWVGGQRWAMARQPVRRIAFLPLEATITGEGQRLLVDGIDTSLREQVLELHAVQVVTARTTASLYAGSVRKSLADLARENQLDAVIHGTAAVMGDRIRINLDFWDARTNRVILSETFQRDLQDILSLYGDIVRKVAEAGNIPVADTEALRIGGPTLNAEACREYLMGLGLSGASFRYWQQSLEHYKRTIALNPEFAPAYTSAAMILRNIAANEDASRREEARTMALKGVELDPKSAPAAAVLGSVEANIFWNWKEASNRYQDAEKLRSGHPVLLRHYWEYLVQTRQCDEAMKVVRRLAETDLSSSWPLYYAHWTHYMCGQFDTAINEAQAALARDPSATWAHYHTAYSYAFTGHNPEAIAECEKASRNGKCEEPLLLAVAGRKEEARQILDRWQREGVPGPFFIALGFIGLGDRNRALQWLAKGYETHDPNMRFIWDPAFASLREDSRFRQLTCKIDLPPGVCIGAGK